MLIVCNGAFKSGSTWIFNIARAITQYRYPPSAFLMDSWVLPSLNVKKLDYALDNLDFEKNHYIVKNHIGNKGDRDRLFARKDVIVINVERNLKDVLVSAYYHHKNIDGYEEDFSRWFYSKGIEVLNYVVKYQDVWTLNNENYYKTHYEDMINNIRGEIAKLGRYLGFTMTENRISEVVEQTSFKKLKNTDNSFFRKGKIGDWVNHFDADMLFKMEETLLAKNV